jgi:hypothetical protein
MPLMPLMPPIPPIPLVPLVPEPMDDGLPDMELQAVSDNAQVKTMIHLDINFSSKLNNESARSITRHDIACCHSVEVARQ